MNTEQIKEINTHLALIEAEQGRIRAILRNLQQPDGIIGNTSDSPYIEQPDYSHLLPEGYEFCADEMAEKWLKVKNPTEANPLGQIWQLDIRPFLAITGEYRPIRKIQTASYQVDWSQAPDWADVHCFDSRGIGHWIGMNIINNAWESFGRISGYNLADGLDWKLSKTYRPR